MGAGLMQLVLYGNISQYITQNPQINYYKYSHNKHTNFITVKQTWKDYFVIYDKQKQNLNKTTLNKCTIYYRIKNL